MHHLPALAALDPARSGGRRPSPTRRPPGRAPSCRCWNARACGCCCRARWSAPTARRILWLPYRQGRQGAHAGGGAGCAGLGRGRLLPRPGPGRAGRAAGHLRGAGRRGHLAGRSRTRAARGRSSGRTACDAIPTRPPALPCLPRCAPALPRRCCARPSTPIRHLRADDAKRGASARRSRAWSGQAAGRGTRPGCGAALPRRAARLDAGGAGRARCASPPRTRGRRTRRWPPSGCCPEPSMLVTVAMAYEGLDAPEVAVVAALTHIRSRPWLEQMVARATRVDPNAGPYEASAPWCSTPTTRSSRLSAGAWRQSRAPWRAPKPHAARACCPPGCWTSDAPRARRHRAVGKQRAGAALSHAAAGPGLAARAGDRAAPTGGNPGGAARCALRG